MQGPASTKTIAAIVCYGAATLALALAVTRALGLGWALERELFVVRASGWCALVALSLALSATPIGRLAALLRFRVSGWVPSVRRALGISAAALATLHALASLATYLGGSLMLVVELSWLRAGLVAWIILLALWLTSYPRAVRALRVRAWKPLHRLAYVAALFVALHTLLAPLAPRTWILAVLAATLAASALRFLPERRAPPT